MGKKSKKRKRNQKTNCGKPDTRQQPGINKRLREHTAEIEYVLRCCFVPMENRTPEGLATLGDAIYRDRIA